MTLFSRRSLKIIDYEFKTREGQPSEGSNPSARAIICGCVIIGSQRAWKARAGFKPVGRSSRPGRAICVCIQVA